jgi:hypothetical protein
MRATKGAIAPAPAMGRHGQVSRGEIVMTVATELRLVTAGTQPWIGAGGDGMGHMEIGGVDVAQVVGETPHLVGKTALVTVQAKSLLMTNVAVNRLGFGGLAMVQSPDRAMGLKTREGYFVDKLLLMALQANLFDRLDALGPVTMTVGASRPTFHSQMGGMIEFDRPGSWDREQE